MKAAWNLIRVSVLSQYGEIRSKIHTSFDEDDAKKGCDHMNASKEYRSLGQQVHYELQKVKI